MNIYQVFEAKGLEAARRFARRSGNGEVVSEFILLERELRAERQREANRLPNFITNGRPAPRVGKTAREGGRSAAASRKAAKRAADAGRRAKMRGAGNGGGGKKY